MGTSDIPGAKTLRNPSGLLSPGVPALLTGVPLGPDLYERNPRHRFPSEICSEIRNAAYRPDCDAVSVVYPASRCDADHAIHAVSRARSPPRRAGPTVRWCRGLPLIHVDDR